MLNLSAVPQSKSPVEGAVAMINLDNTETENPVTEEFGKILEREVAEVEAANEQKSGNTGRDVTAEKQPETAAASAETGTVQANATDEAIDINQAIDSNQSNGADLVQTLLSDTINAYKIDASLKPVGLEQNIEAIAAMPATTVTQPIPTMMQQTAMPRSGEQALGSVLPMANQLLQQKLTQQQLEESNLTALSNNLAQSLELENSAAYGKVLPLAMEVSDAVRSNINMSDTFTSLMPDEAAGSQSFGINNALTSAVLPDAAVEKVQVDTPVGHAKWGGELAQKVVWMATQQSQVAEIHLNPAHLGPVEVMLSISQDQATAQFVSSHPAVRDAIQDALPRLREMLAENGIQLGNVMVGADSFQQENRQQQAYQPDKGAGTLTDIHPEVTSTIEAVTAPPRHNGLVNTYA